MVRDHTVHIAFREQCCKLRGAELLQRHHPAELTDLLIVQRIQEDLPNFVRKSLLRDMRKRRAVLLYILHMNVDPARIFFVVAAVDSTMASKSPACWEMVVKRRSLDADRLCNFAHH